MGYPRTQEMAACGNLSLPLACSYWGYWVLLLGGTWTLARSRGKLIEKIDEAKLELDRRINAETDTAFKQFGETVAALRQKMNEMELWNRDNFVSKGTFTAVMGEIKENQRRLEEKIDRRFDKIDEKLDRNPPDWSGK
jgi:hypothetical protein